MKKGGSSKKPIQEQVPRFADMFAATGTSAHPDGMFVGEIAAELSIPASTLSHHLEKLKNEDLVSREGTYLRYSANTETLQSLLSFLCAECCTRNKAVAPEKVLCSV